MGDKEQSMRWLRRGFLLLVFRSSMNNFGISRNLVKKKCAYLVKDSNSVNIQEVMNYFEQHYSMFKDNIVQLSRNIKCESEESLKKAEVEIEKFVRNREL